MKEGLMGSRAKKILTLERDLIEYCYLGLTTSIGAYLRGRRLQLEMGWKTLAESTNGKYTLDIERGKRFPTKKEHLKEIFEKLEIENSETLSDLMVALENFREIVKKKRFKL